MAAIQVFIDTSSLPRGASKLTPEIERLMALAELDLVRIHISEIAVREWESQLIENFTKCVDSVSKSIEGLRRHGFADALSCIDTLGELADKREKLRKEAENVARDRIHKLWGDLKVNVVDITAEDAKTVFDRYFAGDPPFGQRKNRADLPDAFIWCAASRVTQDSGEEVQIVCNDSRLREACSQLSGTSVYEDLKGLLSSEAIRKASEQLPVSSLWTASTREHAIASMRSQCDVFRERINSWAEDSLHEYGVTHSSIPEDNGEASIEIFYGIDDLSIEWDEAEDMGAGWLWVPCSFECQLGLEFWVFRANAFHVDEWVKVLLPDDFERNPYFEACGTRNARISGSLNLQFRGDDLNADPITVPEFQIDDIDIDLIDEDYGEN